MVWYGLFTMASQGPVQPRVGTVRLAELAAHEYVLVPESAENPAAHWIPHVVAALKTELSVHAPDDAA